MLLQLTILSIGNILQSSHESFQNKMTTSLGLGYTCEISITKAQAQEKRNMFLILALMLVLISVVLCLSHRWEPAYFTCVTLNPQV